MLVCCSYTCMFILIEWALYRNYRLSSILGLRRKQTAKVDRGTPQCVSSCSSDPWNRTITTAVHTLTPIGPWRLTQQLTFTYCSHIFWSSSLPFSHSLGFVFSLPPSLVHFSCAFCFPLGRVHLSRVFAKCATVPLWLPPPSSANESSFALCLLLSFLYWHIRKQ